VVLLLLLVVVAVVAVKEFPLMTEAEWSVA
jgi:hypothetical protein